MKVIHSVEQLRKAVNTSKKVALVPTMGNLHEGHLNLVRQAKKLADLVVISIFVNPIQFGPNEDYERYPRTLEQDCAHLRQVGADIVFAPPVEEMYPVPQNYFVEVPALANELCGAFRPGHFRGVATVVLKLFNLVQPDIAIFGKKDYQQLQIIQGMVRSLNLPIEIVGAEISRAQDGLALSSRNAYLSTEERTHAVELYKILLSIKVAILKQGRTDFEKLSEEAKTYLSQHGWNVDYITIRAQADLTLPAETECNLVVLAAAWMGKTRLIDNLEIHRIQS